MVCHEDLRTVQEAVPLKKELNHLFLTEYGEMEHRGDWTICHQSYREINS